MTNLIQISVHKLSRAQNMLWGLYLYSLWSVCPLPASFLAGLSYSLESAECILGTLSCVETHSLSHTTEN